MDCMSVYRPVDRSPRSDVHQVVEHSRASHRREQEGILEATQQDWTGRRKAKPAEFLFPATKRWIASLPPEFQPTATAECFPRIANALSGLWSAPEELASYFAELFVDRRGRRKRFPSRVSSELHALSAYYAVSRPAPASAKDSPPV
jgi:hypothetical protein